ncbi:MULTISPECIES: hypothetical protein [Methylomonas]|uniref:Uncharacterized protein n=1 Tax=Methylomonas koyamae TaxID=702114 RepID=A0A177N5L4_9GAMM|nr:hypothetical protein [Methylomonas koyamae]OAI12763.1 hypothetical protein A1355_14070 [Methylomonas koyamae]
MSSAHTPETESLYLNQYRCPHCEIEWDDEWNCACNDRCPACNAEIEPNRSDVVGDEQQPSAFAVSYTLDYTHRVMVGVLADSPDKALAIAETAFDAGSIWDDTPEMPVLYDAFEEVDGETLLWQVEEVDVWPKPDGSVVKLRQEQVAKSICRELAAVYPQYTATGTIDQDVLDRVMVLAKLGLSETDQPA